MIVIDGKWQMPRRYMTPVIALGLLSLTACGGAPADDPSILSTPDATSYEPTDALFETAECLRQSGWEVTIDTTRNNESFDVEYSNSQAEAYESARIECEARFPVDILPMAEWSEEKWRDVYAEEQAAARCLREEGYDIAEEPSLEVFRQEYGTSGGWSAYSQIPDPGEAEMRRLNQVCPQPGQEGNKIAEF